MRLKFLLLLVVFVPGISSAQSYKVVTVNTEAFRNSRDGIGRLVHAGNMCHEAEAIHREQCLSRATLSVIEDIARALNDYASRNHLIVLDANSDYEHYCIVEGNVADITNEFIAYYNRSYP